MILIFCYFLVISLNAQEFYNGNFEIFECRPECEQPITCAPGWWAYSNDPLIITNYEDCQACDGLHSLQISISSGFPTSNFAATRNPIYGIESSDTYQVSFDVKIKENSTSGGIIKIYGDHGTGLFFLGQTDCIPKSEMCEKVNVSLDATAKDYRVLVFQVESCSYTGYAVSSVLTHSVYAMLDNFEICKNAYEVEMVSECDELCFSIIENECGLDLDPDDEYFFFYFDDPALDFILGLEDEECITLEPGETVEYTMTYYDGDNEISTNCTYTQPPLPVDFTAVVNDCILEITFSNYLNESVSFNFNVYFDNNSIISQGSTIPPGSNTFTYNLYNNGVYTLVLIDEFGCKVEKDILVDSCVLSECDSLDFVLDVTYPYQGFVTIFNDNNYDEMGCEIVALLIDWGDGSNIETWQGFSMEHEYTQDGVYTICVNVVDRCGCDTTFCIDVIIDSFGNDCNASFIQVSCIKDTIREDTFKIDLSPRDINYALCFKSTSNPKNDICNNWYIEYHNPDEFDIITGQTEIQIFLDKGQSATVCFEYCTEDGCKDIECQHVTTSSSPLKKEKSNFETFNLKNNIFEKYQVDNLIKIYDIYGREVQTQNSSINSSLSSIISDKSLSTGIYFIITIINGEKRVNKVFIE